MSGWIKLDKDMLDDPRLISAASRLAARYIMAARTSGRGGRDLSHAEELRFACNALRGALVTLWIYADTHIREDDTLAIGGLQAVDALVGIEGFCALLPTDWVQELDDGAVQLPGYCAKNGLIAKRKRAADSKVRVARYREKERRVSGVHNAERTQPVTPQQVNDVTRYNVVTKSVDQDLDLDPKTKSPPQFDGWQFIEQRVMPVYPSGHYAPTVWQNVARTIERLHLEQGVNLEAVVAGVNRYAAACKADGTVGTKFVVNPERFLLERRFELEFKPASAAQPESLERIRHRETEEREHAAIEARAHASGFRAKGATESWGAYQTLLTRHESALRDSRKDGPVSAADLLPRAAAGVN